MKSTEQREQAQKFLQLHHSEKLLLLPNVWDAAGARIFEQAGFPALATTSSGLAASLGYADGEQIGRGLLLESLARITRVVNCPVTADIEAGYGDSPAEIVQTVRDVIATGAVGFNIEDTRLPDRQLVDLAQQVELIAALRELARELDVPFVINARVDIFLLGRGTSEEHFEQVVERARAYLQAGADCVYPIGVVPGDVIGELVKAIQGPINIMGGSSNPPLADLARLGVARVSLAGGLMRAVLGHLRAIAQELRESGSYNRLDDQAVTSAELRTLFA